MVQRGILARSRGWASPPGIKKSKRSILPLSGVIDAHTFRDNYTRLARRIVQEIKPAAGQVQAVVRASNMKCPSKPAGAREIGLPTIKRPGGAEEHRLGLSLTTGHHVQHFVDSVDQVDVRPSRPAKQDFGPPRPPFGGVRRQILRAEIRFGLHDPRLKRLPVNMSHENLSDQRGRQLRRRPLKKRERQFLEGQSCPR